MTILTRLGALAALSALAACGGSSGNGNGGGSADVSDLLSSAAVYTPTEADGIATNLSAIQSDTIGDGLTGYMGFRDGTVAPVKIRLSDDESTAYLSVNGGPERPFGIRSGGSEGSTSGTWTDETDSIFLGFWNDNASWTEVYGTNPGGQGYFGLHTAVADLPEGEVGYFGDINMYGEDASVNGNLAMTVSFADSSIEGAIVATYFDYGEDYEPSPFFGTLSGGVSGNQVAMTSDIDAGGVTGTIDMIGGVFNDAEVVAGGSAGTLNGNDMGGYFWTSIYGDD